MSDSADKKPASEQRSLESFSERFITAYETSATVAQWASDLGVTESSDETLVTYPIGTNALGYNKFKGEIKYRSLSVRETSVRKHTWQDGVKELWDRVNGRDFLGWGKQPQALANAALRLPNKIVAQMLKDNPYLGLYANKDNPSLSVNRRLFAADHPMSLAEDAPSTLGSFDNDISAEAINGEMMTAAKSFFRALKDASGEPLGQQMTHLVVPAALEEQAKEFLESDFLVQTIKNEAGTENVGAVTINNRYKGTVTLVVADELLDDDVVYALALNNPAIAPWVVIENTAIEEIISDKDSELYKRELAVGIAYIVRVGAQALLPQSILRITITGEE